MQALLGLLAEHFAHSFRVAAGALEVGADDVCVATDELDGELGDELLEEGDGVFDEASFHCCKGYSLDELDDFAAHGTEHVKNEGPELKTVSDGVRQVRYILAPGSNCPRLMWGDLVACPARRRRGDNVYVTEHDAVAKAETQVRAIVVSFSAVVITGLHCGGDPGCVAQCCEKIADPVVALRDEASSLVAGHAVGVDCVRPVEPVATLAHEEVGRERHAQTEGESEANIPVAQGFLGGCREDNHPGRRGWTGGSCKAVEGRVGFVKRRPKGFCSAALHLGREKALETKFVVVEFLGVGVELDEVGARACGEVLLCVCVALLAVVTTASCKQGGVGGLALLHEVWDAALMFVEVFCCACVFEGGHC
jgi:hypothetical protein